MLDPKWWPSWRYGPNGESGVFERPEDVPEGWFDSPQKACAWAAERAEIEAPAEPGVDAPAEPPKRRPGRPRKDAD